jgi:hypothetical protein
MTGKLARLLSAVLLLAGLAAPALAQPATTAPEPRPSLLAQAWKLVSAPFVALFDTADPDGRSMWDPDGLQSSDPGTGTDGRSMWDPNG